MTDNSRVKRRGGRLGKVRIIGGEWRGRRLPVPEREGLRPTPDRVRETLFNWLAPVLPGTRCLDLYAGTGVLGLEALSRGAASCIFVERDAAAAAALGDAIAMLDAGERAGIVNTDALAWLGGRPRHFDVVFLDPPYGAIEPGELCTLLTRGWLAPGARVYFEQARGTEPALPPGWELARDGTAGRVRFCLARTAGQAGQQE